MTLRVFTSSLHQVLLVSLLLACLAAESSAQSGHGDRLTGENFVGRSAVMARNGMAATSHPLATQIALDVLKQGGSAVDAAIAANAALGFVEPNMCGIGGDLFAIVWDAENRQLHGLNASGRSPLGLSYDELRSVLGERGSMPNVGPLAISVPGTVDGWFALHERFGRLPMDSLLAPAIRYARTGVPVPQTIAFEWNYYYDGLAASQDVTEFDNFRATYLIDGRPPQEGDVFRNPDLARTYEIIARRGRDAFYRGEIADVIDGYARRTGMYLRKEDLEATQSTWVDPVSVNYRGYDVYQLPPNTQGIAGLQMLNLLEAYDLASLGHNSAEYLHLLVEAKKVAFEDRARYYADPAFSETPLDRLLSKQYAAERRRLIDMNAAAERLDTRDLDAGETTYLTIADSEGNMVSLIQSVFWQWGSGMVPDGLGFYFQNRGSQFNLDPEHPNAYEPGKRPFHTIIPGFVLHDGEPFLSFGVMGGGFQPQGHVQVLANIIDFGMNVQEAGDAARFAHAGSSQPTGHMMVDGGRLAFETGISAEVQAALAKLGHRLAPTDYFGGYQAILWDPVNRVYHGGSDRRKDGQAAGY